MYGTVPGAKTGALKEKYHDRVLLGFGSKKASVAVARKMTELMYTLQKNNSRYEKENSWLR